MTQKKTKSQSKPTRLYYKRCVEHKKTKKNRLVSQSVKKRTGIVLLSHMVAHAIPSPQEDLTSEFGMGSGVAPLL